LLSDNYILGALCLFSPPLESSELIFIFFARQIFEKISVLRPSPGKFEAYNYIIYSPDISKKKRATPLPRGGEFIKGIPFPAGGLRDVLF
jgi:hypothetical protein